MRRANLGPRIPRLVLYGLIVVIATLVAGNDVDLVVPESEPADGAVEMLMQDSVTKAAPGPDSLAAKQAIQNIRDLVAYSQTANAKALAAQKSHNSMSHSVITNTITKMAAIKPQALAVSYAKAMGDIRKYYNVGLSKYELQHLDKAVLHGKGVVVIKKETLKKGRASQMVAMLNAKALGLMRDPDIFVKLAVPLNKFTANLMKVEKLSGNADNQVAAECIRAGIASHYHTFLEQVRYKYKLKEKEREKSIFDAALDAEKKAFKDTGKLSSEAPAADKAVKKAMKGGRRLMSGDSGAGMDMLSKLSHSLIETTPQLPPRPKVSADKMKAEAAAMARKWAKDNKAMCSQVIDDIEKMERGQQLTPNCHEIAGTYAQGVISAKKGHFRGKMAEQKLKDDDLRGAIESVTKKVCAGSATGHLISTHPGVATATFKFDKKAKTITFSTGIVWRQLPKPVDISKPAFKIPPLIGCFKDNGKRDLPVHKKNGSKESCAKQCKSYKYFGRQYTEECWCGNSYGKYGKTTGCQCDGKNIGDWKNCVYGAKPLPTPSPTPSPTPNPVSTGSIQNRYGICLDASQRNTNGGLVHMWSCSGSNKNQVWQYNSKSGQIKNKYGKCLDASQRNKTGGLVHMWSCNTGNKNQIWEYTSLAGQIKNKYGKCLDASQRNKVGGLVHMWDCNPNNKNQNWQVRI